ncbi:Uncharacterised protein g8703 [Pycnogonum litorale]
MIQRQRAVPSVNHPSYNPDTNYSTLPPTAISNIDAVKEPSAPLRNQPWNHDYEDDLSGAMGGARIE